MGVVYLAKQRGLNRDVAIKTLIGTNVARAPLARFWAEAEVMAEVKHPNVVQVIELGEFAGKPFMAMEFVKGGSLAGRLRGKQLPPREAATIMERVARGVSAAHDLGIVHRDLKPDNVLMDGDAPKVADFGIAKRKAHDLTHTNAMMGTPAYMAPEQAASQSRHVGPAADVWSLGVMLYECLGGKRPFQGDSVFDVLAKIATEEPPALKTLAGGVPRDLLTIVAKCMTKEPELRYPTAKELADDLARFVKGEPIAARPVGAAERVAGWVRRKPTAAAAWGFSSLAVVLALVVFVVFGLYRQAEGAKKDAIEARDDADRLRGVADAGREEEGRLRGLADLAKDDAFKQKGLADAARNDAVALRGIAEQAKDNETNLREQVEREREKLAVFEYGRTVQVAHQEWRENNVVGARALLDGTKPELRGWEWRYVHRLCNSSFLTLKGHTGGLSAASFSPDGAWVLTGSEDGTARVWDAKTGAEVLALKGHTDDVSSAAFSRDGARVLTGSRDRTARVWDAKTGTEMLVLKHLGEVTAAAFGTDGSGVTGSADKTARVWDAKTGTAGLTLKGHADWVVASALSPDGSLVVTGSVDQTARVWDAKTGSAVFTLKGHKGSVNWVSFSPDGARVLTDSSDKTVRVWDAKTGAEVSALKGHTGLMPAPSFSPDGTCVVTGNDDKTARVWDAKTGAEVLTFKGDKDVVRAAVFSPDGSLVLTADNTARLWNAKTGAEGLTLAGPKGSVSSAAFSPDGLRAAIGLWDGTARVLDTRTGAELLNLPGHR